MSKFDNVIMFHEMLHWVQHRTLGDEYERYPNNGDLNYIIEEQAYRYESIASILNINWNLRLKGYLEDNDEEYERIVTTYFLKYGLISSSEEMFKKPEYDTLKRSTRCTEGWSK